MTRQEFISWRRRLGMTQAQAAAALGGRRSWVTSVEIGRREIDRTVELACWALEHYALDGHR